MTERPVVPDSLNELPQWLLWRYEEAGGRPTKVPYRAPSGRSDTVYKADSTKPATWSEADEAFRAYREDPKFFDGIGFVFSPNDPFFGIDVDNCIADDGSVKPWAQPVLERFTDTYAEISPSGKGVKIWAKGKMPVDSGVAFRIGDGRIEIYDHSRYFTVTGRHWGGRMLDIEDHQSDIDWILSLSPHGAHKVAFEAKEKIPKGEQHDTLVSIAGTMRARGATVEAIFAAIWAINQEQCSEPGPVENIRKIAESAGKWERGRPQTPRVQTNGHAAPTTTVAVNGSPLPVAVDIDTSEEEIPLTERLTVARDLVRQLLDSGESHKLYGSRDNPAPYMVALAALTPIEQSAARRILKEKFKSDFVAKEWDLQLKHEIAKYRKENQQETPYILNDEGALRVGVANAITMLGQLPIAWNSFSCRAFLTDKAPWGSEGNWTDYDDIKAAEWCQHQGLHIPPAVAMDASLAVARDRKPYHHPVVEYLKGLTWDKEPRINHWLTDYLGAKNDDYSRAVAAKWMISAVRRVFEPGCQADYTIVLEGAQGKRKSTALRTLIGSEWFSDDITDIGSKDSAIQLQGKWVVELAELDAFRRAEITTIKAWLVRREDHFRPPYGRRAEDFPRQNVFAASTNKDDWGMDDTGLRRFWPIRCGEIKIDALAAVRDQLWAEAYARHTEKEATYFSDFMEGRAAAQQDERQSIDVWQERVIEAARSIILNSSGASVHEILTWMKVPIERQDQSHAAHHAHSYHGTSVDLRSRFTTTQP